MECNKCHAIAQFSMKGKCLNCGNQQFKSKATIIQEVNTVVDNMVAEKVDRVIMALMRKVSVQ
jgi:predicted  nucleic acid-binding Zn-ribbon protein